MQVYYEGERQQCQQAPVTETRLPIVWRPVWVCVGLGLLIALDIVLAGCSPLRGPATSTARPEAGLSAIAPAAAATTAELVTVEGAADTITDTVADLVVPLRKAAETAPGPVAVVNKGHETIFKAATTAKAAAGQAKAHAAAVTASAGQAEAELARYRQEVEAERAAWSKERTQWESEQDSALRDGAKWAMGLFGLIAVAGLALLFASPAARGMAVLLIVGGGAGLALASMVYKWAPLFPYLGVGVLLAAGAAGAWKLRQDVKERERKEQEAAAKLALSDGALAGAVGFGEALKAKAPEEAIEAAKAWAKANTPKEYRDRIWQELPTESARK